jgi:hypothetical protein
MPEAKSFRMQKSWNVSNMFIHVHLFVSLWRAYLQVSRCTSPCQKLRSDCPDAGSIWGGSHWARFEVLGSFAVKFCFLSEGCDILVGKQTKLIFSYFFLGVYCRPNGSQWISKVQHGPADVVHRRRAGRARFFNLTTVWTARRGRILLGATSGRMSWCCGYATYDKDVQDVLRSLDD